MTSSPKKQSDSEVSEKNSNCSEHLQDINFTSKCHRTDLQLKVKDTDLYVPKSHLAMVSPVFRRMFESDFKEKDPAVLPLPDKNYEDVLTFLKCTHPGALLKVTYDIVPKMLPLAHEYQVKWLLDDCASAMIMMMDASKCSKTFQQSWRSMASSNLYGLNSVVETFIERFSPICYEFYKDASEFSQISIGVRYKIVCRRLAFKDKFE
ncbi:hypothetical protein ACJMK2_028245 [Sinanodonta woodiana]|uniref:BTB domain-containing protein n=1 Tax=Sinanodonta woodiana TaxID=1069815 RepID=A0ABD3X8Q1_SINWO